MGGMNKDVDTRLIKNPDYIDGLNIRVVSSSDGTIGSVENIEGNERVSTPFYSEEQETIFLEDNGVYEEVNPSTVFHQKVLRIYGWEEDGKPYNFKLYSDYNNPDSLVETREELINLSWQGGENYSNTAYQLVQHFGEFGFLNSGIPIYDVNTGFQYTASVVLLTFNQYSELRGGYLEVIIQADHPGVNFSLTASSDYSSGLSWNSNYKNDYLVSQPTEEGIPITENGNMSISLDGSFETGGFYNTDVNEDGFIVSPDGTLYDVGNRMLWRLRFKGNEPTDGTNATMTATLDNLSIFSYRSFDETFGVPSIGIDGSVSYDSTNGDIEVLPFLNIAEHAELFISGNAYEFTASQDSLSTWLSSELSFPTSILADDMPLTFNVPPENIVLTFQAGQRLNDSEGFLDVMIVGPVGVKFNLAIGGFAEGLISELNLGDTSNLLSSPSGISSIFSSSGQEIGNVTVELECVKNLEESSLELTDAIYNSFESLQDALANSSDNSQNLLGQVSTLQEQLEGVNAQIADLQATATAAGANIDSLQSDISNLEQGDISGSVGLIIQYALEGNVGLQSLQSQYSNLQVNYDELEDEIESVSSSITSYLSPFTAPDVSVPAGLSDVDIDTINDELQGLVQSITDVSDNYNSFIEDLENQLTASQAAELQSQSQIEDLQFQLSQLESTLNNAEDATFEISEGYETLNNQMQDYLNEITNLTAQLASVSISSIVVTETLNELDGLYASVNNYLNQSIAAYGQVDQSSGLLYEEDFSPQSDHITVSGTHLNPVVENAEWGFIDAAGYGMSSSGANVVTNLANRFYAKDGHLKFPPFNPSHFSQNNPFVFEAHTGMYLTYANFQNTTQWLAGRNVTIVLSFELDFSEVQSSGPLNAEKILVTNWFDPQGYWNEYEEPSGVFLNERIILSDNQGNSTNTTQTINFTIPEGHNIYNELYNNIILLRVDGEQNTQVRLTNIHMSSSGELLPTLISYENAVTAGENFISQWNNINNQVLAVDVNEDISDELIGQVVPGHSSNEIGFSNTYGQPNLWGLLSTFQNEVFGFTGQVQTTLYNLFQTYSQALNDGNPDLGGSIAGLISGAAAINAQLETNQLLLSESEANVADLEAQINFLQANIESGLQFNTALTGPYNLTTLIHVNGPEPAFNQASNGGQGGSSMGLNMDQYGLRIFPVYEVPQDLSGNSTEISYHEDQEVLLPIITKQQYQSLIDSPVSLTNNFFYYVRQNIPESGFEWEWEIPSPSGSFLGTQKARVFWLNFNENNSSLSNSESSNVVLPRIIQGLDITSSPYGFDSDNLFEFSQMPAIQLMIVYDTSNATNNAKFNTGGVIHPIFIKKFDVTALGGIGSVFNWAKVPMTPEDWGLVSTQACTSAILNTPEL